MKKFFILLLFIFSLIKFSYADESYTVNIPTSNGAYKTIILTRSGDTYIGPQGEHYGRFPTVVQLQAIYGGSGSNPSVTAPVPVTTLPSYTPLSEDQRARMTDQQIATFNARMQQEAIERQKYNESMQQAVRQRQELDRQMQVSMQKMDATQKQWKDDAKKQQDEAIYKSEHPFPPMTPAEKKKNDLIGLVSTILSWTMLLGSLGVLIFILLLHIPNRLISPEHLNDVPMVVAVRRGMSKAQFNKQFTGLIIGEGMIFSIILAFAFKSFLVLAVAFIAFVILIGFRTAAFIWIYLMSVFWMMLAASFGFYLSGGHFETTGSLISACVGAVLFAAIGFFIAWGIHTAGLQYLDDISS